MRIEIVVRFRCVCGRAVEDLVTAGLCPPSFEGAAVTIHLKGLPTGWIRGPEGEIRCPDHPVPLVQPATVADAAATLRASLHAVR